MREGFVSEPLDPGPESLVCRWRAAQLPLAHMGTCRHQLVGSASSFVLHSLFLRHSSDVTVTPVLRSCACRQKNCTLENRRNRARKWSRKRREPADLVARGAVFGPTHSTYLLGLTENKPSRWPSGVPACTEAEPTFRPGLNSDRAVVPLGWANRYNIAEIVDHVAIRVQRCGTWK